MENDKSPGEPRPEPAGPGSSAKHPASPEMVKLAFFSVMAGATSLIPLPFLDDWTLTFVRRKLVQEIFSGPSLILTPVQRKLLWYKEQQASRGCLGSAFLNVIVTPLRLILYVLGRLFRKIFFILALKEATDRASQMFHEGYLLLFAGRTSRLRELPASQTDQAVLQLSYAVLETIQLTDTSPIRALLKKTFRGSHWLLLESAATLGRLRKRWAAGSPQREEEAEKFLGEEKRLLNRVLQPLASAIESQTGYLSWLEEQFRHYATRRGLY